MQFHGKLLSFSRLFAISIVFSVTTLFLNSPAYTKNGMYLGMHGGVGISPDETLSIYHPQWGTPNGTFSPYYNHITLDFNEWWHNYNAGAELGYKSGSIRYEMALVYFRPQIESLLSHQFGTQIPIGGGSQSSYNVKTLDNHTTGGERLYGGFLNILVDFDNSTKFSPYLGGGLGYIYGTINIHGRNLHISGEESGLGYQAMAGILFHWTDSFALFLDYRYIITENLNHHILDISNNSKLFDHDNEHFQNHSINVGAQIKIM